MAACLVGGALRGGRFLARLGIFFLGLAGRWLELRGRRLVATLPEGPTIFAAMMLSNPPPEPMSTTVSPGAILPRENGFPTPAKDSTASSGRPSKSSSAYSSILANGRPWWKWSE